MLKVGIVLLAIALLLFSNTSARCSGKRERETFVYVGKESTCVGILDITTPVGPSKIEERNIGKTIITATWGKSISIAPDGKWIAYSSSDWTGRVDIYISSLSGDVVTIQQTSTAGYDRWPEWSPDGAKIVFTTDLEPEAGNLLQQVCEVKVRIDTQAAINVPRIIVGTPGYYSDPAYSPDGRNIAYLSSCVTPYGQIVVVNSTNGNQVFTVSMNGLSLVRAMSLRWRPDRRILFSAATIENPNLDHCYLVDNYELVDVTPNETTSCMMPTWYKDEQASQQLSNTPLRYRDKRVLFMNSNGLCTIRAGNKDLLYQFDYDYPNPQYKSPYILPANRP